MASPLLANIALDGMEQWLAAHTTIRNYQYGGKVLHKTFPRYGFIRYADDFVITAKAREDIEAIIPEVANWLKERGLKLNEEKTRVCHLAEGFNFLGFNIRQYKSKCLIKPQREKVQTKLEEIKQWLDTHQNAEPAAVICVLNPILRGWANYYRHAVSKRVFAYFDHPMVQMLIKWAKRRHPAKGMKWVATRYFGRIKGDHWVFKARTCNRRGETIEAYLYRLATMKITRHVLAKIREGSALPDQGRQTYGSRGR